MIPDVIVCATDDLTISELSRLYNISMRTLRFYEQKGFLKPRRIGRARLYSAKDRVRLELILTGKKLGFSLRQIYGMVEAHQSETDAEPTELVGLLTAGQIEQQLADLHRQRVDIDEAIAELKATLTASR